MTRAGSISRIVAGGCHRCRKSAGGYDHGDEFAGAGIAAVGSLSPAGAAGPRRHGHGLAGPGRAAGPAGGDQGGAAAVRSRRRGSGHVATPDHAGGAGRGPAAALGDRDRLRRGRAGRPAVDRHGAGAALRVLAEVVRDRGPLPPQRVAPSACRVLDALVAAHAAASCTATSSRRTCCSTDGPRGAHRLRHRPHVGDATLTSTGLLVGSPGLHRAGAGPRARLARAGGRPVVARRDALCRGRGTPPFERAGPLPTLTAVVMDEPDPPQRAGPLRPVIDALLVKDPAHRIGADDTRLMLQRVLRGRPAGHAPLPTGGTATERTPAGSAAADGRGRAGHARRDPGAA